MTRVGEEPMSDFGRLLITYYQTESSPKIDVRKDKAY
jgi:hypothetical protein